MRTRRIAKALSVVVVAVTLLIGTPAVASADPGGGGTYCSGWSYAFSFRFRACTGLRTTRVDHSIEVQYLGPGTVGLYYSGSDYRIADYWGDCTDRWGESYYSGQYRSFYCSTARVSGVSYQTRATIGDDSGIWATSPSVSG